MTRRQIDASREIRLWGAIAAAAIKIYIELPDEKKDQMKRFVTDKYQSLKDKVSNLTKNVKFGKEVGGP